MSVLVQRDLDLNSAAKIINIPNPSSAQDAATKAYVDSAIEGLSWKDSVRVATSSNVNLASPGTIIDGSITMAVNDRFLAKGQTLTKENGIYVYNGVSTAATRALDLSTAAEAEQAVTTVEEGTSAGTSYRQTQVNFVLETDPMLWTAFGTNTPAASESTAGAAQIATQVQTDAGTDNTTIVTPLKLATYSKGAKRLSQDIGGSTSMPVTHGFNTLDVQVYIRETGGSKRQVLAEVQHTDVNTVTILTATAPASGAYRVTVIA
jgi:hypothetical protein